MPAVWFVLLSILTVMETYSQPGSADRYPAVAGRFYSADKETLRNDISKLFENCKKPVDHKHVRAIISPHAGYIYSGRVAASAFSAIGKKTVYKNIFIIGSSHIMAFEGASAYYTGDFVTPLGKIRVNREIANSLRSNRLFNHPVSAHLQEHSLEVQIPFIQYYLTGDPMIVPVIIGTNNINSIKKIAEALKPWFNSDNLFIISSDFSHYPGYKTACEVDKATADAIISGDPQNFLNTLKKNSLRNEPGLATSMCGWTSGLLLMYLAEQEGNLEFSKVDYCNSGDSKYGNKDEVVGYNAIILAEKKIPGHSTGSLYDEISFTAREKEELIALARNNIRSLLNDRKMITVDENKLPAIFKQPLGAFVTLKIDNVLRGCIGKFISSDPLFRVVLESSKSSAFEDPRFPPLTKGEFAKTDIEITVLGPLKKITDINEIILGKHGIYIKKDFHSGTMLPQVAKENGWTVEEFLGYTSRDKTGIGWDGWKKADIFVYEGIVLDEIKK